MYLFVSLVFVAAGVWMIPKDPLAGYLTVGFFGVCAIVFAIMLLPNSSYLHLTEEGFIYCNLFRVSQIVRWRDVADFSVTHIRFNPMVGWRYVPEYLERPKWRAMNRFLAAVDDALPNTYGMKAQRLATLMNSFRKQCG